MKLKMDDNYSMKEAAALGYCECSWRLVDGFWGGGKGDFWSL